MRADPRKDKTLLSALKQVAPGTTLRSGIDDIIRANLGALIVIGDPNELAFLYSGGMRLDLPLTSQLLYELAKMDGAIVITADGQKLVYANVQLMPDPAIPSNETGTRHRTAERVAKQTDTLARTNQALGTLETYRTRLEQGLTRLTALEFQSAVVLDDVLVVLQRAEMTTRMAAEIERNCVELGEESRLIRMQLDELMEDVPREKAAVVYDYERSGEPAAASRALEALAQMDYTPLLEFEQLAEVLGYNEMNPLDHTVQPRGHRVLSRIPRLPDSVIRQVVRDFESLDAVVRASHRDLEAVDGVGSVRAREIREGLRRLQEHNLVDRYLQL